MSDETPATPTQGGRYRVDDGGKLVQVEGPTTPSAAGPRNADGSSVYTTDKFKPAAPVVPDTPRAEQVDGEGGDPVTLSPPPPPSLKPKR
ncbi:hypothetical protein D3874_03030 [Oleomonas cavernae]|uniref:Uncharacterized protein n=1 Tax=Oleomonas cavernae TaxID=2320859 RepID=A0A418WU57_9PROT|nr:hypothetical protein [Oleomonas cavernae]RJF94804.1 hypothetical protein D3874_03030 [Oleomonas cavernae]